MSFVRLQRNMLSLVTFLSTIYQINALDPHRCRFRAGHSTVTAFLAVTKEIHTARAAYVIILLDRYSTKSL